MKENWIFKIQAFFYLTRDYLCTDGYSPKSRWIKLKTLTSNFKGDREHFEIRASKNDGFPALYICCGLIRLLFQLNNIFIKGGKVSKETGAASVREYSKKI